MKSQKLLVIAATVCLLVGVSGAAMARNDCPDGFIIGGEHEEIVIDDYVDCVVVGVAVTTPTGVRVRNARSFTMMNSYVKGEVRVITDVDTGGSFGTLLYNFVDGHNIVTKNLNEADVRWNTVVDGNIRVIENSSTPSQYAEVIQNRIKGGNLVVKGNVAADVKGNRTIGGNITCRDNLNLDVFENEAIGGTVDCSREFSDLFPDEFK